MVDRPHAVDDAERSVIGAVLLRNEVLDRVHLDPSDFFDPRRRLVWSAILDLARERRPIDSVILEHQLNGRGSPQVLGALLECVAAVPTADNVEVYAEIVANDSLTRRTRLTLSELASDRRLEGEELVVRARRALDWLRPTAPPTAITPVRIATVVDEILAEASLPYIPTGLAGLDAQLGGGLRARMLHVIVAGSGKGKTSLAVQVVALHAERGPGLYYSGELTRGQLAARLIGQRTDASWREVLRGGVDRATMLATLEPLELDVLRACPDPVAAITAAVDEMLARGHGTPLVVIDYAQLLADIGNDMRLATMTAIRQLTAMVERRDVVLLLLSQGSRPSARAMAKGGGSPEDYIDMAAETSDIEKAAATVIVLTYANAGGAAAVEVTAQIAKQRLGGPGRVGLKFHGASGRWEDLGHVPVPAAERAVDELTSRIVELVRRHPAHFTRGEIAARLGGTRGQRLKHIANMLDAETIVWKHVIRQDKSGRRQAAQVLDLPTSDQEIT